MISGLCQICGRAVAVHTCSLCGRMVCASHYDSGRGVCATCLAGKKGQKSFG